LRASTAHLRYSVALAVLTVTVLASTPAMAAPSAATKLQSTREQAGAARTKMERMRAGLASDMSQFAETSDKLAATRAKIAANNKRLKTIEKSVRDGEDRLSLRAAFQYRTGTPGMIDVLLSSSSFEDFSARLYVFSEIAKQDSALIEALKIQHAEAIKLRADLAEREAAQIAQRNQLAARRKGVQKEVDAQNRYLDSLTAEVSALVAAQDKPSSAVKASAGPKNAPKPSKTSVSKAGAIVYAAVEGRSGKYAVMSGDPLTYRSTGIAWTGVTTMYGNDDNGSGTASGRPFDENEFTCAHKTLPFGTRLAVSNGSKRVIVTVTDRGPYTPGRMLDLSRRSGRYLGIDGVGTVKVEIVQPVR